MIDDRILGQTCVHQKSKSLAETDQLSNTWVKKEHHVDWRNSQQVSQPVS